MHKSSGWQNFLLLSLLIGCASGSVAASTIAIIGTGQVAQALGPEFAAQGHTIVYGSRSPEREETQELIKQTGRNASATSPEAAAAQGDMVVLAVPGMAVADIVRTLGSLAGKVIIDPTNPLVRDDKGRFALGISGTSNAEIIQAIAPAAHVVKAFNTLSWRHMIDPDASGGPISIPIVGDNAKANLAVAKLAEGMGLEPIDLGPLSHAGHVEGLLILWINNRYSGRESFEIHFRKNATN